MTTIRHHAIVIGGSMSGMLAGRILSDHYEQVTVIDRDDIPSEPRLRDGTPQARHLHILLAKGQMVIEGLFPGIEEDMIRLGATTQNWGKDSTIFMRKGWTQMFDTSLTTHGISRLLLEWCIRQRLQSNPHIQMMNRTQVKRLVTTPDQKRVIGVEIQAKGTAESTELQADLVVDVSGRTSNAPDWLAAMGCGDVEETVVNSFLGYATRWYKRPAAFPADKKMITIQSFPPRFRRGGAIMEIENGDCIVTLVGVNKDYPPTDEAGFLEFAYHLLSPAIYEIIRDAEPLSKIHGYQRTENRWRHYERFSAWPEGFVIMGDAACAFNPIYGQGMTTGALEAVELGRVLSKYTGQDDAGMAKVFQKSLARVVRTPWLMATGEDLRYPGTIGGQVTWLDRFVQMYIEQYIYAMPTHPEITNSFLKVMNLLQPPTTLFQPTIFLKVMTSWLRERFIPADGGTAFQSAGTDHINPS